MKHIFETIMLAVIGFILFIGTVIYHMVVIYIKPVMMNAYNESGIGGKANPIFSSIIIYGYAACLIFFAGAIILYLIQSHEEEFETYEERMYNQR